MVWALVRVIKRGITNLCSSEPRVFPKSGWESIDPSYFIEEETIPTYRPEKFYPAHIGEIINHRYQIVGKLGYGSSASNRGHAYITLKIYTASTTLTREIEIYNHQKTIQSNHADSHRTHTCLVHPPLGISLDQLTPLLPGQVMTSAMVRATMRNVLAALDFLHTEAQVIHTDLQPNNMLLGIKDDSILSKFEQAELDAPVARKTLEDRTIYTSRPLPISLGTPVLCDLGEARVGTDQQQGDIMPDVYRAPEVILGMTWDYKVDIWNVGMVVWDLLKRRHLFKARDPDPHALLRSPPGEFLARSEKCSQYWNEDGQWKGAAPLPDYSLESREEKLHGDEKQDFLRFLRRTLC
ncbi:kinase-like domain-containing protein [Aspergillus taichungensis]|uniref:Kinase-like domain-containing protein n=1 Tax=Aspergillus taichungensis TaxID=482145 RepID=A0A2J5I8M6_9EURO|nr:kinase-like domain-containing protein [Aspergillus taichungensis]